jgi:DNA-binding transcriptional LysR family regulator
MNFRLFKQLWMFSILAEELHFGRAATRLGMSQPPLTEQIKILENALKIKLFNRSRRGTTLTPAGLAILPTVKSLTAHLKGLENVVREVIRGQTGILNIGAITSAMLDKIPLLVNELKKHYPHLSVYVKEIDSVEAIPALEKGEIDVAFARLDEVTYSGIASQVLERDFLSVAISKNHRYHQQKSISIASLEAEKFVMSSRQVSPVYFDMMISACRKYGFTPKIFYEVQSIASQMAYVGCGQGVALVPESIKKIANPNVLIKPLSEKMSIVSSAIVWNTHRYHPMIQELRKMLNVA